MSSSLLLCSPAFAAVYKVLPDARIAWADVWVGAAVTALLFTLGKFLIGLYLGAGSVGSPYGAAGSLAVFLVWIYYSSQVLFLGAEFAGLRLSLWFVHPAGEGRQDQGSLRADQSQATGDLTRQFPR